MKYSLATYNVFDPFTLYPTSPKNTHTHTYKTKPEQSPDQAPIPKP